MTLSEEIRSVRDRALADLYSAHDYYSDTTLAWDLVAQLVTDGQTFLVSNSITGTTIAEAELVAKSPGYVSEQLTEATFQQFVSTFEAFFFDFLRLWLTASPQSLGGKKLDFKTVLEATDKDAITQRVVAKEVNEILYDRPSGWFAYLDDKVRLGCPSAAEIERIAEIKASRDVLAHGKGIANTTYVAKAGKMARFREGDRIEISEPYHREAWELTRKVVADVSNAAIAKFP